MTLAAISEYAAKSHLMVMGALHEDSSTVVLLGPLEPDFWAHVTSQPELNDAAPDPLDRWSKRVITNIAHRFGAQAVFPSDGPPYPPFISWALASGRCFLAPSGLLVHDQAGLMVSFRGALRVPEQLDLPAPAQSPCETCRDTPCVTACPVDALKAQSYDVPACQTHIRSKDDAHCRTKGCAARRACPVSQRYGRQNVQSAFHMKAFLGE